MNISTNITSNENNMANQTTNQNKVELSLSNAAPGGSFQGEILDVRGNNVSIQVGKYVLNALLDQGVNVNIGDRLSFLVKGNEGDKIFIKPVADKMLTNNNSLLKIMNEASINITERNVAAVKELMSNGMPIDRATVQDIGRLLSNFKDADVSTIISLKSHNIPVNNENIKMFESYQNNGGNLLDGIKNIVSDLKLFSMQTGNSIDQGRMLQFLTKLNEELAVSETIKEPNEATTSGKADTIESQPMTNQSFNALDTAQTKGIGALDDDQSALQNGISEKVAEKTSEGSVETPKSMSDEVDFSKANSLEKIEGLIKEITKKIQDKTSITPDKLADRGNEAIKELYKNIAELTEKITKTTNEMEHTPAVSKLVEHAADLKNNLNFMSDLNEMAAYAQIPVKLNEKEQNSELYVLSRNKKKTSKDGPLTAFLHLDMEALGATDIRISMQGNKVNTKFSINDQNSVKIVEAHLGELAKRLEELGYQAAITVEEVKEKKIPFENILEMDRPKQKVQRFSFDVRA